MDWEERGRERGRGRGRERERERERERQIHVRICYDRWVFATVANTHFSSYGYLLP